jgi:hypothetical protein
MKVLVTGDMREDNLTDCYAELDRRWSIRDFVSEEFRTEFMTKIPLHPSDDALPPGRAMQYGLFDPRNAKLRYIGYTLSPTKRYWAHVIQRKSKTHRSHWIRELVSIGYLPIMVMIDHVPLVDRQYVECRLIALFHDFNLTNATDGGDGTSGHRITQEMRLRSAEFSHRRWAGVIPHDDHELREIKRRERYKRVKHDTDSRQRISEANRGSNNHSAKLTATEITDIRNALASGALGVDLARRFGVSPSQISRIRRGTTWK